MFKDRYQAGELLADALTAYKNNKKAIILAIPRGALQIGKVLHEKLNLPLDIIVTKKIPHPNNPEYAIGAVGLEGEHILDVSACYNVSPDYVKNKIADLQKKMEEKYVRYRGNNPKPNLRNKLVIIVDDGIATGNTIITAIKLVKRQKPARIVVVVPVSAPDAAEKIRKEVDDFVCLIVSEFMAISQFYDSFPQVEDEDAIKILKECSG
ncbi:MAG TPA: phosphoribosyltransferase family protein [Candidatus Bilamarchaeaceae archaeon]|nr:phosphoribosyltransferase family protein [Candidatus Bilamarchaeaceae archaeon]